MLTEPVAREPTPEALLARYEEGLRALVESAGARQVVDAADVDEAVVEAVERGDAAGLDLRAVAEILALEEDGSDADAVLTAVRDHLLLSMTSAMLTVDRVAAAVDDDLDPNEVQGKVEGRLPMTLGEYARIHHAVASAK